jgi:hypothetical protein
MATSSLPSTLPVGAPLSEERRQWVESLATLSTRFADRARVTTKDGALKMAKPYPRVFVPGTEYWVTETDKRGRLRAKKHGVLLLSDASKMPSLSFSLPAGASCPWALYGEGTICGDCYAQKGRYVMPDVANAQRVRFEWVRRCMRSPEGIAEFVSVMVDAITRARNSYFRGHDSGDMFSPAYVRAWVQICRALPDVRFWFPSRAWRVLTIKNVSDHTRSEWALALSDLASLPNVALRPSALFFNAPAPRIPGWAAGTTAADEGFSCPAPLQGNICGSCRVCFDRPELEVSYHRH